MQMNTHTLFSFLSLLFIWAVSILFPLFSISLFNLCMCLILSVCVCVSLSLSQPYCSLSLYCFIIPQPQNVNTTDTVLSHRPDPPCTPQHSNLALTQHHPSNLAHTTVEHHCLHSQSQTLVSFPPNPLCLSWPISQERTRRGAVNLHCDLLWKYTVAFRLSHENTGSLSSEISHTPAVFWWSVFCMICSQSHTHVRTHVHI